MKLGCIGDDFTGSSDLGNMLAKEGMRVTQYTGIPDGTVDDDIDAGVVALKSRTIAADDAVRLSLEALAWLQRQGCTQFFFKYCSTFDSTESGNIGPVIEALMERLDARATIACPAFPATGRSVYQGHLFVNDKLLNESGMEDHPLTPMTDADLRRWLGHQTRRAIGHVPATVVFDGASAISTAIRAEVDDGRPIVIVDAIRDADLHQIGAAVKDLKLVTGGSGIASGLPANLLEGKTRLCANAAWQGLAGPAAIIAGSASKMTRTQVERYAAENTALEIDADAVMSGDITAKRACDFAMASDVPALLYSSADPETVRAAQERHGRETIANKLEGFFAETARLLTGAGVQRLVIAGGETSGAVVEGLGLAALRIGPEIAPGVPALEAADRELVLALKSGNFGDEDFFATALDVLGGNA